MRVSVCGYVWFSTARDLEEMNHSLQKEHGKERKSKQAEETSDGEKHAPSPKATSSSPLQQHQRCTRCGQHRMEGGVRNVNDNKVDEAKERRPRERTEGKPTPFPLLFLPSSSSLVCPVMVRQEAAETRLEMTSLSA